MCMQSAGCTALFVLKSPKAFVSSCCELLPELLNQATRSLAAPDCQLSACEEASVLFTLSVAVCRPHDVRGRPSTLREMALVTHEHTRTQTRT